MKFPIYFFTSDAFFFTIGRKEEIDMGYIYWQNTKEIAAFTTDRNGGVSPAPFAHFNQAYQVGDAKENVLKNRNQLCADHGFDLQHLITCYQQHTDIIMKVDSSMLGAGSTSFESGVGPCDALYTTERGLALGVFHADCVPVFVYAPKHHLVGIIHAGAKGTFQRIVFKSLKTIIENEHIPATDLYIHLGPAISFSHYTVPGDPETLLQELGDSFSYGIKVTNGVSFVDLPLLNVLQAREIGILARHISVYEGCTYEEEDRFYSYRREKETGRHLSVICLRETA